MQDSRKALEFLSANDVDLCFMDLVMPHVSGIELACMIRYDLKKTFPIIAVSAFYMDVSIDQCREVGMPDLLRKPVCFEDIKNTLSSRGCLLMEQNK